METARRVADAQGLDDHDGHALAGFIDAEASFGIRPNNGGRSWVCHMTLTQRDDDADMLVDIARVYVEREIVLPTGVSGQDAYVAVLRALATEEPVGKLTATAYERARERHPEWPTRNTIAAAFDGWARALEVAGLVSRVTDRARSRARRA